jgi:uncharacterized protein YndB with AHSA1/START domain
MSFDLQLSFFLSAPPARVMQLITDATLIRRWSGEEGTIETKEGGAMSLFDGWTTGTVTETDANKISFSWRVAEWTEETPETMVQLTLRGKDGGCEVTVQQTGFTTEDEMKSHKTGWNDFFFDPLEDYIMIFENRNR